MRNHVPASLLRLSTDDLQVHGLYELLRNAGINLKIAKQSIGARAATAAEAQVLGETRRAPLLTMTRSAYDDQGRAVEHGSHIYRGTLRHNLPRQRRAVNREVAVTTCRV
jgi:DNA-binding GntR family transcriptional regulator